MYEGFIRINKLSIVKHNKLLIFWDSYIFLQINPGTIFLLIWGALIEIKLPSLIYGSALVISSDNFSADCFSKIFKSLLSSLRRFFNFSYASKSFHETLDVIFFNSIKSLSKFSRIIFSPDDSPKYKKLPKLLLINSLDFSKV